MDDHTVGLKDGSMLQVVAVEGFRFETQDYETLQHNVEAFNTLLKGQRRDIYLYTTLVRRREVAVPGGSFPPGFSDALNTRWLERFTNRDVFTNELYLTIVKTNPAYAERNVSHALDALLGARSVETHNRAREQMRLELSYVVRTFMNLMHDFGTRRLGIVRVQDDEGTTTLYSDVLRFLSKVHNHDDTPCVVPTTTIDTILCKRRPYFKHRTVVQEGASAEEVTYSALLSLKEYPATTWSGILNRLLRLPYELVLTQSFVPIPNEKARKSLETLKRRLTTAGEHEEVLQNVSTAIGELALGVVAYGDHHLSIMCTEDSPAALERAVAEITPVFTNVGIIMVREDLNLEPAFWAQLPGNVAYIARASTISTKNVAAFASFHNYSTGKLNGNHLGPALTVVPTPGDTPYFMNLHVGKLGNTCIFGPTTSGKTTFATFLISQSQKYGGKTIVIDKDRSWELYVRAENGSYIGIRPGARSCMNPLHMPDTRANRRYLTQFLTILLEQELTRALLRHEKDRVADAIDALYDEFEQKQRSFGIVQQHLVEAELREALNPWVEGQHNGWVFDNREDTLSFENPVTGIDVTWLLEDDTVRAPVMSYLLYRMQAVIDSRELVRIVLEEGWRLIRDEALQVVIEDWERTVRKKNAFVLFSSQDPDVGSRAGRAIYEQSATKIFFPHFSADKQVYCSELGLSEAQFKIIKESHARERKVFVKHGDEAVVVVFDLSFMPDYLSVLAGTTETVHLMHRCQREFGDDASLWLPHFLKEVQREET